MRLPFRYVWATLTLVACSTPPVPGATAMPGPVDGPLLPASTLAASATPLPTTVGVPTSVPAVEPIDACAPQDDPANDYRIEARLDVNAHTADVRATARVSNRTGEALTDLAFGIAANLHPGALEMRRVTVDTAPTEVVAAGPWLKVLLPVPLGLNCRAEVGFDYRLNLPEIDPSGWGWRSAFGWTPRQTVLGEWYPVLTTYRAEGGGWQTWAVPPVGEFQPAEASRVSVRLEIPDGEHLRVLGGSVPTRCDGGWCFEAGGVRFFTVVVSDRMEVRTDESDGHTFVSAYFPEDSAAGEAALRVAAQAFRAYTRQFGPIARPSMTVVEADFFDGMEYSGLALVGQGYYAEYDGTPKNYLTLIVAHETAHQWWYGSVGNDPAVEPWLDEALATLSEVVYLNDTHPGLEDWWWDFRVHDFNPTGQVDATVYEYAHFRPYVNAVYLRGALMLRDLRGQMGEEDFNGFLRTYAEARRNGWATAADFWRALEGYGGSDVPQ